MKRWKWHTWAYFQVLWDSMGEKQIPTFFFFERGRHSTSIWSSTAANKPYMVHLVYLSCKAIVSFLSLYLQSNCTYLLLWSPPLNIPSFIVTYRQLKNADSRQGGSVQVSTTHKHSPFVLPLCVLSPFYLSGPQPTHCAFYSFRVRAPVPPSTKLP